MRIYSRRQYMKKGRDERRERENTAMGSVWMTLVLLDIERRRKEREG